MGRSRPRRFEMAPGPGDGGESSRARWDEASVREGRLSSPIYRTGATDRVDQRPRLRRIFAAAERDILARASRGETCAVTVRVSLRGGQLREEYRIGAETSATGKATEDGWEGVP
mgnify:CR=1 FL=1